MDDFLTKINRGFDGLIRSIRLIGFDEAEIIISTMDAQDNFNWINVRFVLSGLVEMKINQSRNTSNVVMSSGIVHFEDSSIQFIDFSPYSDEIESVDDIRKSDVYFGCKKIACTIEDYAD